MLKRLLALIVILSAFGFAPAAAQTSSDPTALVPASFAAFIEVRDQAASENGVRQDLSWTDATRISEIVALRFAPQRLGNIGSSLNLDALINLAALTDAASASFQKNVLSWLDAPFVVAYQAVSDGLRTKPSDTLLIVPTHDPLAALSGLSAFSVDFKAQDYNGVSVYQNGEAAFAMTDRAVLIGSVATVQAALDVQAGTAPALVDTLTYRAIRRVSDADYFAFAYAQGEAVPLLASGLLSDDADGAALYAGLGAALADGRTTMGIEGALWGGAFDGVGATLGLRDADNAWLARAVFHSADDKLPALTAPNADLLARIPANAFLTTAGDDFALFARDALHLLPMLPFSRQLYSGLPILTAGSANTALSVPTADTLRYAVDSFISNLQSYGKLDLPNEVITPASGAYALAFLPRPNNPLVALNIPFDAVLVLKPTNPKAALDGLTQLLRVVFATDDLTAQTLGDVEWTRLGLGGEVAFSLGIIGDQVVVTTGADAPAAVMNGNGLVSVSGWESLSAAPALYADMDVLYNTFYPDGTGLTASASSHIRATLHSETPSADTLALVLRVLLPQN